MDGPHHPAVTMALWLGAGLATVLGGYLIAKATIEVKPPEPPLPNFGLNKPEILQAIGPYGVLPVTQTV